MSTGLWYAILGVGLFVLGGAAMLWHSDPLRRVLAFNVLGSGAFLTMVGLSQRHGHLDAIAHAMVLTGIVVALAATALALALIRATQPPTDSAPNMPVAPTVSPKEPHD